MRTYAFDFINNQIHSYASRKDAQSSGNGRTFASDETELSKANVATGAFVELYNRHCEVKIQRFSDRATAVKRIWALALAKAIEVKESEENMAKNENGAPKSQLAAEAKENKAKAAAEKKAAAVAAKEAKASEPKGEKGRASKMIGATVYQAKWPTDGSIPAREGSKRHGTYEIFAKIGSDGMKWDDFTKAGGSNGSDLHLAIFKGLVKVVDKDGAEVPSSILSRPNPPKTEDQKAADKAAKEAAKPAAADQSAA